MDIQKQIFGNINSQDVYLFTLKNSKGVTVKITNYGGVVTEFLAPDKNGKFESIVLGFSDFESYVSEGYLSEYPYLGCIVGRYANRIKQGKFTLDGVDFTFAINNGPNHLHGGKIGWDKKVWDAEEIKQADKVGVKLSYLSKDMEEGYPGNVKAEVAYLLTEDNELVIEYSATTDKTTHINLTNHTYFNLTANEKNILDHELQVNADKYTVLDDTQIPTGEIKEVKASAVDFIESKKLGKDIDDVAPGYDLNFIINKPAGELGFAALLTEEETGRKLEVFTTEPGVQVYTGNYLNVSVPGSQGKPYLKHSGVALEAQHYPDSPNKPEFPSTLLKPGETYTQTTVYKAGIV